MCNKINYNKIKQAKNGRRQFISFYSSRPPTCEQRDKVQFLCMFAALRFALWEKNGVDGSTFIALVRAH